MKKVHVSTAWLLAALLTVSALAPASAQYRREVVPGPAMGGSANCWAVGESVAAQEGGELMNATPAASGGRQACVVVIVIRNPGQPPRRVQRVVPLN